MATFLFVHGAWHGGWCWKQVEARLRAAGHQTHAPTLTGVGERSHLARPEIDADTHVEDILNVIKWRELENVILVGHSYGGLIITGVAGRAPEKIRALVYLDAFAPEESGLSLFATANPDRLAGFEAQLGDGGFMISPDLFDAWTDDPAKKAWLKTMCTPHPVECFRRGVTLTGREAEVAHRHYIIAARNRPSAFWGEYERVRARPDWTVDQIATKHDAMVEDPDGLATKLGAYAGGL